MQFCPKCQRIFEDDDVYCPDDGSNLAVGPIVSAFNTPTQILQHTGRSGSKTAESKSSFVYVIVGALGATVVALVIAVVFLTGGKSDLSADVEKAATQKPPTIAGNLVSNKDDEQARTPKINSVSIEDAKELINRWSAAQAKNDFSEYRSYYSREFIGIKQTPDGRPQRMEYNEWMNDRRKSIPNIVSVNLENLNYSPEGELVVVTFRQQWRSLNHCDVGKKVMTIKMFADGPKITSEKISDPAFC